jgi:hypothetical protein
MSYLSGIRYGPQIVAAAASHGLDPKLLAAVAAQETGGPGSDSGRNIVGDGGHGHGLFQIDDRSWGFAATPAAMDPAKNADMAASILQDDLQRYGGNVNAALSAYNSGSPTATGTRTTWPDGSTLGYADSVLRHYQDIAGSEQQQQLLADNRETAGAVNQLAAFGAAQPAPYGAAGSATFGSAAGSSTSSADPNLLLAMETAQQQQPAFAAPVSWAQTMSASGAAGGTSAAAADLTMANLVDPGASDADAGGDS